MIALRRDPRRHRRDHRARRLGRALRAHDVGPVRRLARGHAVVERGGDLGRVPVGRVVPRHRRAADEARRRRAVAAARLHGRLPRAAAVRGRAAAALRLVHDPRLRRGAAALAAAARAVGGGRAADRRLLPRAAAQGRRADARRGGGHAVLGRRRRGRRGRRAERRARRDARHHLRAGVPVLGQDVRDRAARLPAADPPRRAARARGAVRPRATRARPEGGLVVDARRARASRVPRGRDGTRRRPAARASATASEVRLPAGRVELPAGTAVPVAEGTDAQRGEEWAEPVVRRAATPRRCSSTRC